MTDELRSIPAGPSAPVPAVIRPEHKTKYAIVYPRQSSLAQVKNNTGSTESQRDLAKLPLAYGWPPELVIVMDEDLGKTATSTKGRGGFQRVEAMMDRGEVSLVMVRDSARLTRDPEAGERFLKKAARAGILLEANGQLADLAQNRPAELFGLRVHNLLAWWDNESRKQNFQAAKDANIKLGQAVSRPPIGYVKAGKGHWIKDPDPAIREVIQQIKDRYLEFGSTRKTALYLQAQGIKWPRRMAGRIEWDVLTWSPVLGVVTNPNYTTDYYYGRRRALPTDDTGRVRSEPRPSSEWRVIKDHHEPYITRDEWERIQSLVRRGPTRQPPAGRGSAWLQGLLMCGRCDGNRWMRPLYDVRTNDGSQDRVARYCCYPVDRLGQLRHQRISCSAPGLDHIVFRAFVDALTPLGIEMALAAARESEVEQEAAALAWQRQVQRAEQHAVDLKRHFLSIDPSHHKLSIELEQDLDQAIRDRDALRRTHSDSPKAVALTAADATELEALVGKIEDIWFAPTTTNEDRKHILSTVISKVILHDSNEEMYDVEIVWASGISGRKQFLKVHGGTNLVRRMRTQGRPVSEILETVTALGLTTQRGRPFNRKALQHKLWMLGFNKKGPRVEALLRIRSMLVARRSRQEILETLRTQGPQPYEGEWTTERITTAIKSIQSGAWAPEVPPLPADAPRLRQLPPEAIDIFIHGRRMGWTFMQIADELNALGFRTPRGAAFTSPGTYQLYQHFKKDPSLAGALPPEAPLPALRADGQPRRKSGRPAGKGRKSPMPQRAQEEEETR